MADCVGAAATCVDGGAAEVEGVPNAPWARLAVGEPPVGGVAVPPVRGVPAPPVGGVVPVDALVGTASLSGVPVEAAGTVAVVESTFASTRVPSEPAVRSTPVEAAGVETDVEADTCAGVVLTVVCVEAAGVETDADAEAAGAAVLALLSTLALAAGVLTLADVAADADDAGLVLALTVAEAAGVLTVVVADTDGVDEVETLTVAAAETLGACGTPGSPSACAGTTKARHPRAHTAAQLAKRNPCDRGITAPEYTEFSPTSNF